MTHKVRDIDLGRRQILKLGLSAAALGSFGGTQAIADPEGTWGQPDPTIFPPNFFPTGKSLCKILEIHLYGGLSPWETFYHRPVTGTFSLTVYGTNMCRQIWGVIAILLGRRVRLDLHRVSAESAEPSAASAARLGAQGTRAGTAGRSQNPPPGRPKPRLARPRETK